MSEIIKIKANSMFQIITELLAQGQSTRIAVSGSSMYPFLRDTIDSVELSKGEFADIKKGDIVMIKRLSGVYVMHRILKKGDDSFYMVGDAQQWIEGPIKPTQLIAVVNTVWRKNKKIKCSNLLWRILTRSWLFVLPTRRVFLKLAAYMSCLKYKIKGIFKRKG